MPTFIIYLIKANIALTLFYLAYRFGLRRLTFYTLNRFFLLFGIAFAALFPLVNIDTFFQHHEHLAGAVTYYAPDWNYMQQTAYPLFTIWNIVQYIFWAGVLVMAIRLILQLFSLFKIHIQTTDDILNNEKIKRMHERINPFSFFKNIYVNPELHSPEELESIIRHEKIHVKGWHAIDVLVGEINNIFYWFNPGAWLIKTAIRENIEFITDRKILRAGTDAKAYQYSLIHVSVFPYAAQVVNNFNFSHLKKRIIMMNKKRSRRYHLLRYLLVLPVIAIAALIINSSRAQSISNQKNDANTPSLQDSIPGRRKMVPSLPADYKTFLQRNPSVRSMIWTKPSGGEAPIAIIHLKDGKTERYHLMDTAEMKQAKSKYGNFPVPPPPPPPSPMPVSSGKAKQHGPAAFIPDVSIHQRVPDTVKKDDHYYTQISYIAAQKRNYRLSVTYANKALKLNPDNGKAQAILSYIMYMKGYQQKMKEYESQHSHPDAVSINEYNLQSNNGNHITPQSAYALSSPQTHYEWTISDNHTVNYTPVNPERYNLSLTAKADSIPANTFPSLPDKVLYIINGKEESSDYLKTMLSPQDIGSVTVLKDNSAVSKYGLKAKDGVIEIKTKEYLKDHPDNVNNNHSIRKNPTTGKNL